MGKVLDEYVCGIVPEGSPEGEGQRRGAALVAAAEAAASCLLVKEVPDTEGSAVDRRAVDAIEGTVGEGDGCKVGLGVDAVHHAEGWCGWCVGRGWSGW